MSGPTAESIGFTWANYLENLIVERGSLAAIALKLAQLDGPDSDAESIERSLRRLRSRGNRDGGVYGQKLLRTYGIPPAVEQRIQWMGVYHSRFTDLPVSLCLDQLRIWDRPPISESRARIWIHLGFATCFLRSADLPNVEAHMQQARLVGAPPLAARIELALLEAFVASGKDDRAEVMRQLDLVETLLNKQDEPLTCYERDCLFTRLLDQRAYQVLHPAIGAPDYQQAKKTYEEMPTGDVSPFVANKRETGLAYVCWKQKDTAKAIQHAEAACRAAGDGGYVRLRIGSLGLLAHIANPAGQDAKDRAIRAAKWLEDEALTGRLSGK